MLLLESYCRFTPPAPSQLPLPPSRFFGGTAFSGIHCWLLVSTPGRQGDVTRPGGRWYQLPPVTGTSTKSLLPPPALWLSFPLPARTPSPLLETVSVPKGQALTLQPRAPANVNQPACLSYTLPSTQTDSSVSSGQAGSGSQKDLRAIPFPWSLGCWGGNAQEEGWG